MYLLNQQVNLEWELLATASPPILADLDLIIITPEGISTYYDAPFSAGNYTAPTATVNGLLTHPFTPVLEGLYRLRLVTGTSADYQILSRSDAMVFDRTSNTAPYNEWVGKTIPYDIQFSMQGFFVPDEIMGLFVASRVINIDIGAPGSTAAVVVPATASATTLDIMKDDEVVGDVHFPLLAFEGVVTIPNFFTLNPDETLRLRTRGTVDSNLRDIAVNINARVTIVEY